MTKGKPVQDPVVAFWVWLFGAQFCFVFLTVTRCHSWKAKWFLFSYIWNEKYLVSEQKFQIEACSDLWFF